PEGEGSRRRYRRDIILIESLLPPGEGARSADEGRVISSESEGPGRSGGAKREHSWATLARDDKQSSQRFSRRGGRQRAATARKAAARPHASSSAATSVAEQNRSLR